MPTACMSVGRTSVNTNIDRSLAERYGAPKVTGVTPSSGPVAGGTVVTINGRSFGPEPTVRFGGVAAPQFNVVSSTEMTATAPAHSPGTVNVTVQTPAGLSAVSSADFYRYQ